MTHLNAAMDDPVETAPRAAEQSPPLTQEGQVRDPTGSSMMEAPVQLRPAGSG